MSVLIETFVFSVSPVHKEFQCQRNYKNIYTSESVAAIKDETTTGILYHPQKIEVVLDNTPHTFFVEKRIDKNDLWKVYYIVSQNAYTKPLHNKLIPIRIDSGCVSGQIYDDEACDCLDQLHSALLFLTQEPNQQGLIIHIPTHDGRGFGTAPKAETEIYKRGGKGRIHTAGPMDTVEAARLLYGVENYDLRSYDGAAKILQSMGIERVLFVTDNVVKIKTLKGYGIEVIRQKTGSQKASCLNHIEAKKRCHYYLSE